VSSIQPDSLQGVLARIQEILPQQPQQPTSQSSPASSPSFAETLAQLSSSSAAYAAQDATGVDGTGVSGAAAPYETEIQAAGERYGVDPRLLESVIQQESGFDPNATSAAGAQGLMQLMPQTAASLGVTNAYDPAQSIDAGARYLKGDLDRFGGDPSLALAAYNAGAGAVEQYGGVPPYAETQNYVQQVLGRYEHLTSEGSTS
jgi:soluble lytic murein transglycosylase-like protein